MMATPPDFSVGQVLTAAHMNAVGLWEIKSQTFTSASSVNVTNCFNADFENYHVVLEWLQNTSNANLELKMRDSSGDISTNYGYETGGSYYASGVGQFAGYNNSANETQTSMWLLNVVASYRGQGYWDVFGPNLTRETRWLGRVSTSNASATNTRVGLIYTGRHNATTACTGFSLIPSAGTISGTVRVYGYRN